MFVILSNLTVFNVVVVNLKLPRPIPILEIIVELQYDFES